jgi:hypothetical protein
MEELIEGIDFYWVEKDGIKYRVFTESYLLKKVFAAETSALIVPTKRKARSSNIF